MGEATVSTAATLEAAAAGEVAVAVAAATMGSSSGCEVYPSGSPKTRSQSGSAQSRTPSESIFSTTTKAVPLERLMSLSRLPPMPRGPFKRIAKTCSTGTWNCSTMDPTLTRAVVARVATGAPEAWGAEWEEAWEAAAAVDLEVVWGAADSTTGTV